LKSRIYSQSGMLYVRSSNLWNRCEAVMIEKHLQVVLLTSAGGSRWRPGERAYVFRRVNRVTYALLVKDGIEPVRPSSVFTKHPWDLLGSTVPPLARAIRPNKVSQHLWLIACSVPCTFTCTPTRRWRRYHSGLEQFRPVGGGAGQSPGVQGPHDNEPKAYQGGGVGGWKWAMHRKLARASSLSDVFVLPPLIPSHVRRLCYRFVTHSWVWYIYMTSRHGLAFDMWWRSPPPLNLSYRLCTYVRMCTLLPGPEGHRGRRIQPQHHLAT